MSKFIPYFVSRFPSPSGRVAAVLAAALLGCCVCRGEESSVLWWMVDDPLITLLDGVTEVNASSYQSVEGYSVNAARVRVDGTGTFLQLYAEENGIWQLTQYTEAWTDDGAGSWTGTGWVPADLGQFDSAQYSFLVELGYIDNGGTWTTLAISEAAARNNLAQHISLGGVGTQPQVAWTPSFAVPEPSGGLLFVTGGLLLLLRRRRPSAFLRNGSRGDL